ncbi:S1 family peptidase [Streptomyces sp. NPDC059816]|uniref:S1 family peptidase n=1 Tax=Streptomyces sp. NPDC059816 TaxID=3346960 RepID=UPI003656874B
MNHRRIPPRKAVLAGAAVVALAAAAVVLPNASASPEAAPPAPGPRQLTPLAASELASRLTATLGGDHGGSYYDVDRQQLVVNVVRADDAAVQEARESGAVIRGVDHSINQLKRASGELKERATIPGTSWAVDPVTNRIRVTADRTVTGERWDRLTRAVAGLGDSVARIERSTGEFAPFVEGGDAIFGGGSRCSLGFNVTTREGTPGFLTAGHCAVAAARWSDDNGTVLGSVRAATFPGAGDLALVGYDDPGVRAPSSVNTGQGRSVAIDRAADATVGQSVQRMGSTTGLRNGRVTGLNATVNYPEGTVSGLIQTDVCAEPGDSGGPLFTGEGAAVGLTSGGSGNCTSGGVTFFQPVTTALAAFGARIGAPNGNEGQQPGDPTDAASPPNQETGPPPVDEEPAQDDD